MMLIVTMKASENDNYSNSKEFTLSNLVMTFWPYQLSLFFTLINNKSICVKTIDSSLKVTCISRKTPLTGQSSQNWPEKRAPCSSLQTH